MKEDFVIKLNRIMVITWFVCGILGLIVCGMVFYESGVAGNLIYFLLPIICFIVYGYKKYMLNKFFPKDK